MATISQARAAFSRLLSGYQVKRPARVVYLGDGRGTAETNMRVPGRADYVFARESLGDKRFFPVLNRARVQPAFNLPVVIGYTDDEPEEAQVLGVHYGGLGQGTTGGDIPPIGPHRTQHQFRGGDEVYSDSRLFLPGLVRPESPASMQVVVEAFVYYFSGWNQFPLTTSADLTTYKPVSGNRYLLITLDPATGELAYRPGGVFSLTTFNFGFVPPPPGDEYPLGIVLLTSSTTKIDWDATTNNLADGRLHFQPSLSAIMARLEQLEGYSGNDPDLPCTGTG